MLTGQAQADDGTKSGEASRERSVKNDAVKLRGLTRVTNDFKYEPKRTLADLINQAGVIKARP